MKAFSVEKQSKDTDLKFIFSGYIDENAKLPESFGFAKAMTIDLGQASGINSVGTKNWCKWLESIRIPTQLENCPVIFIRTFNNVIGALSKNVTVKSFFVPFLSTDGSGTRKDVLFRIGTEVDKSGMVRPPKVLDENKKEMEMDVLPNFFNFLKK